MRILFNLGKNDCRSPEWDLYMERMIRFEISDSISITKSFKNLFQKRYITYKIDFEIWLNFTMQMWEIPACRLEVAEDVWKIQFTTGPLIKCLYINFRTLNFLLQFNVWSVSVICDEFERSFRTNLSVVLVFPW